MVNNENRPPASPALSRFSPANKAALSQQRDHSACRRPQTPLKVRKTRENLRQCSIYGDIPPPCLHSHHDSGEPRCFNVDPNVQPHEEVGGGSRDTAICHNGTPHVVPALGYSDLPPDSLPAETTPPNIKLPRQRSVRRRMLSKVKQGITSRSKSGQRSQPTGSETSLLRRISGRRKQSTDTGRAMDGFALSRDSLESQVEDSFTGARSFTSSTVSTAEVLGHDSVLVTETPDYSALSGSTAASVGFNPRSVSPAAPPSPSPEPTPRPIKWPATSTPRPLPLKLSLAVPCITLDVVMDRTSVDVHAKIDTWIAITATAGLRESDLNTECPGTDLIETFNHSHSIRELNTCAGGSITSLRICFKPMSGCRVSNVVGQKSSKNLTTGQKCTLFVKIRIPRLQLRDEKLEPDAESMLTELESIVGTLVTEVLHIDVRYRHSLLPSNNVVTVRHTCPLRRPKIESRWSWTESNDALDVSNPAQTHLVEYLAKRYAPEQALGLIWEYLEPKVLKQDRVAEICAALQASTHQQATTTTDGPDVIVTAVDDPGKLSVNDQLEHFSTAPSTPVDSPWSFDSLDNNTSKSSSSSSPVPSPPAPSLISAPKKTTAVFTTAVSQHKQPQLNVNNSCTPTEDEDTARKLWHHIRRTSLSARQLEEISSTRLDSLEASDENLKTLRRDALANKRSVGAETLRAWKWEGDVQQQIPAGEAPWM